MQTNRKQLIMRNFRPRRFFFFHYQFTYSW